METVLAILMLIGIFIGIPVLIGLAVVGIYVRSSRRIRRDERVIDAEIIAEAQTGQPAESQDDSMVDKAVQVTVEVTH